MDRLIKRDRSLVIAADVTDLGTLGKLVRETCDIKGVAGYKIGFELALAYGLDRVVRVIRLYTDLPIIYDHQKAGTDIPKMGKRFARVAAQAGVDAVILFPFGGPLTEDAWIKACQAEGLTVIVGAHMTHDGFFVSQGGFIANDASASIYARAARGGVRDFVVPGNRPESLEGYRHLLEWLLGEGNFDLYAPGFIAQGGDIVGAVSAAGKRLHAIVGRGIYEAVDFRSAAIEIVSRIEMPLWTKLAIALWNCGAIQLDFKNGFRLKDGSLSPIYIDLRRIRSYPEVMDLVVGELAEIVSGLEFDCLADVPTAATPITAVLANSLRVPQITPRMDNKEHGLQTAVDGVFLLGDAAVLMDDVVTRAGSKLEAVEILRRHGLTVGDVVVVIDRQQGGTEQLAAAGCRLHSVLELVPVLQFYAQSGLITQEELDRVLEYLGN